MLCDLGVLRPLEQLVQEDFVYSLLQRESSVHHRNEDDLQTVLA